MFRREQNKKQVGNVFFLFLGGYPPCATTYKWDPPYQLYTRGTLPAQPPTSGTLPANYLLVGLDLLKSPHMAP